MTLFCMTVALNVHDFAGLVRIYMSKHPFVLTENNENVTNIW